MHFRLEKASSLDIVGIASRVFFAPKGGRDAAQRLLETCANSSVWAAVDVETSAPAGLWGASPSGEGTSVGKFWMLAIENFDGSPEIVPLGRIVVEEMLDDFDVLENHVEAQKQDSLELLRRIGFKVEPAQAEETTGRLLHRVWIGRAGVRPGQHTGV